MRWKTVFWDLIVVVGLTSCAARHTYGLDANGRKVDLQVGERLVVSLPSNPSTGYAWQVDANDESLLALDGEPAYHADFQEQPVVGSGGETTFTFRALASGQVNLRLVYLREWETDVPPAKVYEINVVIH